MSIPAQWQVSKAQKLSHIEMDRLVADAQLAAAAGRALGDSDRALCQLRGPSGFVEV